MMKGERIQIPLLAGQHWLSAEMPFNDGPKMNDGLVALWFFSGDGTSIANKPYRNHHFQGNGPTLLPLAPSLDLRVNLYPGLIRQNKEFMIHYKHQNIMTIMV